MINTIHDSIAYATRTGKIKFTVANCFYATAQLKCKIELYMQRIGTFANEINQLCSPQFMNTEYQFIIKFAVFRVA